MSVFAAISRSAASCRPMPHERCVDTILRKGRFWFRGKSAHVMELPTLAVTGSRSRGLRPSCSVKNHRAGARYRVRGGDDRLQRLCLMPLCRKRSFGFCGPQRNASVNGNPWSCGECRLSDLALYDRAADRRIGVSALICLVCCSSERPRIRSRLWAASRASQPSARHSAPPSNRSVPAALSGAALERAVFKALRAETKSFNPCTVSVASIMNSG
jgi:hypothetical protein